MKKNAKKVNPRIAERLSELLNENDKTQAWLAKEVSISPSSVSYWMSGDKEPAREHIEKCAELFECSPAYILGYSDFRTDDEERKAQSELFKQKQELLKKKKKLIMDAVLLTYELKNDSNSSLQILKKKKSSSPIAFVNQTHVDWLIDGCLDMMNLYVDHFIEQHSMISEEEYNLYKYDDKELAEPDDK